MRTKRARRRGVSHVVIASIVLAVLWLPLRRAPRLRPLALREHPAIIALDAAREQSALFIPGARGLDDAQTLAGISLADAATVRDAGGAGTISLLASHPLVTLAARDRSSNLAEIAFSSSDPWGFAINAARRLRRERPALCAAVGGFSGEAILFADAAEAAGVPIVCGTADLVQAPALIVASDAVLIGEEIYSASAIVSGSRARVAMLRGHDTCRALAIASVLLVALASALAAATGSAHLRAMASAVAIPFRGGS